MVSNVRLRIGAKVRFLTVDEIMWKRARKTRGGGEISKELLELAKKAMGR